MVGYQNILCATDFSSYANEAFLRSIELANLYNAKLTLLHVVEYFPEDRSNVQVAPEHIDPKEYQEQQVRSLLEKQVGGAGKMNVNKEIRFSSHSARPEIIKFAEEQNIDLIIVASHGHHGISPILGSTANSVVHSASCDVLVTRAPGQ